MEKIVLIVAVRIEPRILYKLDMGENTCMMRKIEDKEKLYRDILNSVNDVVFLLDRNHKHIAVFGKWLERGSADQEDFIGKTAVEIMGEEKGRVHIAANERALKGENVIYQWSTYINGVLNFIQTSLSPIYDDAGEVVQVAGVGRNITELVDLNRKLQEAKDAAEAAYLEKGELIRNISHEIRTPMNSIMGMAELLRETSLTEEQRGYTDIILDSSYLLLHIIEDILDLSKLEARKISLNKQIFEARQVIDSSLKLVEAEARRKKITLLHQTDLDKPLYLIGDGIRLRQVMLNLLNNAVKFTNEGRIIAKSRILEETEKTAKIVLEVEDTGIGIAKDSIKDIFKPFVQEHQQSGKQHHGTGLGLAICEEIIKLMGGEIRVESEKGKGSTFSVILSLPKAGQTDIGDERKMIGDKKSIKTEDRIAAGSILVVEDNPVNQKVILHQLNKLGYKAQSVSNGREAVKTVMQHSFAAILMDCQLPDIDGYKTAQLIRSIEDSQTAKVPIIAMTGNALLEEKEKCMVSGMTDYIAKPTTLQGLSSILEKWCGGIEKKMDTPAKSSPESEDAICEEVLKDLEDIGEQNNSGIFLARLLEGYLNTTAELLQSMNLHLKNKDMKNLRAGAHNIKSSSAYVGALNLSALAKELEAAAAGEKLSVAAQLMPRLHKEFILVKRTLSEVLADRKQ
ncbi:PAS domain S-box-containing protein [Geosporobacter subterraneus DSM 17957]|uniref:Circadian input-output histidine kinase CikA n=1 Tax=Geosporobacter subterraneus DSM 17957 TaxID=1121919 RepID=A0A1M6FSR0_9FIRM|nr:PAS domain-containing sensor histidine kinase [Geosporobacter subterraneus]SHJ00712.1 PAS domain S-box-containing protein [Geosporobacter subterraneus DSM 17957]